MAFYVEHHSPISLLMFLFFQFPSSPLILRFSSNFQQYYGIPHYYGIPRSTRSIHFPLIPTLPTLSHLQPSRSQMTSMFSQTLPCCTNASKPHPYSSWFYPLTISPGNPLQRLIFVKPFQSLSTHFLTTTTMDAHTIPFHPHCSSSQSITMQMQMINPLSCWGMVLQTVYIPWLLHVNFCTNNHMPSLERWSIRALEHLIIRALEHHTPLPSSYTAATHSHCLVKMLMSSWRSHCTALSHAYRALGNATEEE